MAVEPGSLFIQVGVSGICGMDQWRPESFGNGFMHRFPGKNMSTGLIRFGEQGTGQFPRDSGQEGESGRRPCIPKTQDTQGDGPESGRPFPRHRRYRVAPERDREQFPTVLTFQHQAIDRAQPYRVVYRSRSEDIDLPGLPDAPVISQDFRGNLGVRGWHVFPQREVDLPLGHPGCQSFPVPDG